MFKGTKIRFLRIVAKFEGDRKNKYLNRLTIERKYVYQIARKLLISEDSVLESSPRTGIYYVKNDMRLVKFDEESINFVNGKFSYHFSYERYLIQELRKTFHRRKENAINRIVKEISAETNGQLQKIYSEIVELQKNK